MSAYELPTSINVMGVDYAIRSDFRAILDVLIALNDKDLDDNEKAAVLLQIVFVDWEKIPRNHLQDAINKAVKFIDCNCKSTGKPQPKMVDWEQDANLIIPAINKVAHTEIRAVEYLHWWTFFSYYMEIGEGLFSNVIHIRQKKTKGEKLEKWEQRFYKENKSLIDFEKTEVRSDEEKEMLRDYFGYKKSNRASNCRCP
jgi:hypothetical protein